MAIDRMRIDKWLWAARFFKTRSLASDACEMGRVDCNGQRAKPSREIRAGDHLRVTNESGIFTVEVILLTEARGSGTAAQAYYAESEESKAERTKLAAERKAMMESGGGFEGRPTRQDRRATSKLRGRIVNF